jgi:hypothetical protein
VLSGVTDDDELKRFAYQPNHVLPGVGDIVRLVEGPDPG